MFAVLYSHQPDKMQYNLLPKYFNQSEPNFSSNIYLKKHNEKFREKDNASEENYSVIKLMTIINGFS